jgi:hypothetical protein
LEQKQENISSDILEEQLFGWFTADSFASALVATVLPNLKTLYLPLGPNPI